MLGKKKKKKKGKEKKKKKKKRLRKTRVNKSGVALGQCHCDLEMVVSIWIRGVASGAAGPNILLKKRKKERKKIKERGKGKKKKEKRKNEQKQNKMGENEKSWPRNQFVINNSACMKVPLCFFLFLSFLLLLFLFQHV